MFAIDQHWRWFGEAMYQEGFKGGRSAAEADAARHKHRDELERELLTMPIRRTKRNLRPGATSVSAYSCGVSGRR
jgi:hypothetical protein